jgi:hypothetical protein
MNNRYPALLVVAVALLAMGSVLQGGVLYDGAAILGAERMQVPVDWTAVFTDSYWSTGLWRPATIALLAAQVTLANGISPVMLHATSLGLYLIASLLLYGLSVTLGADRRMALLAAVLFVAHPLHAEVVASVVGQAELLVGIAMLAAMWTWQRAARVGVRWQDIVVLLMLQLLAAGSKEQGYLLPAILLAQHWLLPVRVGTRVAARWLTILTLAAITMWLVRAGITGSMAGEIPAPYFLGVTSGERILAALSVIPRAILMTLAPLNLGLEYGPPDVALDGRFGLLQLLGIAIIIIWIALLLRWRTRNPLAALGILFAAITWLPASSLIVPAGLLLADRVLFLPTVGLAISLAALPWPAVARRARALSLGAATISIAFVLICHDRIAVWRDEVSFHSALTRDNPGSYRSWFVAAMYHKHAGNIAAAEEHLRQALVLWARDPRVHEELGQLLRADGRCAEAIPIMRSGLELDPERHQLAARLAECERRVAGAEGVGQ